jgi:DNA-binding FadR family transcriptional regulator
MSCTVHIHQVDDSFAEGTVESMADARRAIEARAAELASAFSCG